MFKEFGWRSYWLRTSYHYLGFPIHCLPHPSCPQCIFSGPADGLPCWWHLLLQALPSVSWAPSLSLLLFYHLFLPSSTSHTCCAQHGLPEMQCSSGHFLLKGGPRGKGRVPLDASTFSSAGPSWPMHVCTYPQSPRSHCPFSVSSQATHHCDQSHLEPLGLWPKCFHTWYFSVRCVVREPFVFSLKLHLVESAQQFFSCLTLDLSGK